MMDTKNNTLNENYDSSSILGGDDFMTSGTMSPMPMGKVQQSKTSSSESERDDESDGSCDRENVCHVSFITTYVGECEECSV